MPKIGPYSLHTIETGRFRLDGGAMFGIVPRPLWEQRTAPDERNRILLHMRCLLLESSDRLVLIDTGLGDKYDDKFGDIYAVDHEWADLQSSLHQAGFSADEVTDVVLTHLHFDHCGGCTRRRGNRLEVVFPEARHHVQRRHWQWAREPNLRERGSFLAENLDPLAASGQLHLVDGPDELLPGIEVVPVDGHTDAQQIVKVADADSTLVYVADLLPTHHHLAPVWTMGYDVRPLVTMREKAAFLEDAVEQGWHLYFEHDPDVVVADLHGGGRSPETTHHRTLDAL